LYAFSGLDVKPNEEMSISSVTFVEDVTFAVVLWMFPDSSTTAISSESFTIGDVTSTEVDVPVVYSAFEMVGSLSAYFLT